MKNKTNNPKAPMPQATPGAKPTGKPVKSDSYKGEPVASKAGGKSPGKAPLSGKGGSAPVGDKKASHGGKPGGGKGGL